jgi:hypothetical protein
MKRLLILTVVFGGALLTLFAGSRVMAIPADEVRWEGFVGIIVPGNVVGSGTGAVTGAGQVWVTTGGRASVELSTGDIRFEVTGLVLGAGNSVGTPGSNNQVRGTLLCDINGSAGSGNSVRVDTPLVPLTAQGDAEFQGNVGPLPAVCLTETDRAFFIRSAGNGNWFAAAIVRTP